MNAPVDVSFFARAAKPINSYRPYWAKRFGVAPFLPMSRSEMEQLGWDSCDIILVTGDAYVDHPSFGMAIVGRLLEAQGFRVGIIAQPDWTSAEAFKVLGKPNLFWGVTSGNMDSMINRYTADRKIRSDDAYTPGDIGGKRPDRAAISKALSEATPDRLRVVAQAMRHGFTNDEINQITAFDPWFLARIREIIDAEAEILGWDAPAAGRIWLIEHADRGLMMVSTHAFEAVDEVLPVANELAEAVLGSMTFTD